MTDIIGEDENLEERKEQIEKAFKTLQDSSKEDYYDKLASFRDIYLVDLNENLRGVIKLMRFSQ